jgi:MFS family permease
MNQTNTPAATFLNPAKPLSLTTIMLCGGLLVSVAMGIRHGFGFWQLPLIQTHGWTRETFTFAIALQQLVWGFCQPLGGMLADKFGTPRVAMLGAVLYACGLVVMGLSSAGVGFAGGAGVLIGMGLAGSTYAVVFGVIGRAAAPEKRSWALGVVSAMGSFGQFFMMPVELGLLDIFGPQSSLYLLALVALMMIPLAFGLREPVRTAVVGGQSMLQAVKEAMADKNFRWLMAGYSVCGFQVVFIGQNLPAMIRDGGLNADVARNALMLIGLFNVIGTYTAGTLGGRFAKKNLLSAIYFGRSLVVVAFLLAPFTPFTVYAFASAMGLLWLSTVPLTSGVIGTVFGVQYLGMLSGVVFLSHQLGSFIGMWVSGWLYDSMGNYHVMWGITIALGVAAGLANLPIREQPNARMAGA